VSLIPVLSVIFTVEVNVTVLSGCELGEFTPSLENKENLSDCSGSEIRDSNPGPPDYEAQVPGTIPLYPLFCVRYWQLCYLKCTYVHSFSVA
jgi:hypothetical protein